MIVRPSAYRSLPDELEAGSLGGNLCCSVATGALLLQLRTWFTSGPRVRISIISDGLIVGGNAEFDEDDLVLVTATNVGAAATMITNLTIEERYPFYYFWRQASIKAYIVANPQLKGYPPNVPHLLEPAHQWTGVIRNRPDIIRNLRDGDHYAVVHTTGRNPRRRRRIKPSKRRMERVRA
jgi:hypothetical protein